jgi:hypothetical protein
MRVPLGHVRYVAKVEGVFRVFVDLINYENGDAKGTFILVGKLALAT